MSKKKPNQPKKLYGNKKAPWLCISLINTHTSKSSVRIVSWLQGPSRDNLLSFWVAGAGLISSPTGSQENADHSPSLLASQMPDPGPTPQTPLSPRSTLCVLKLSTDSRPRPRVLLQSPWEPQPLYFVTMLLASLFFLGWCHTTRCWPPPAKVLSSSPSRPTILT